MALSNSTVQELRDLTFALIGREYDTTTASYGRINTHFGIMPLQRRIEQAITGNDI